MCSSITCHWQPVTMFIPHPHQQTVKGIFRFAYYLDVNEKCFWRGWRWVSGWRATRLILLSWSIAVCIQTVLEDVLRGITLKMVKLLSQHEQCSTLLLRKHPGSTAMELSRDSFFLKSWVLPKNTSLMLLVAAESYYQDNSWDDSSHKRDCLARSFCIHYGTTIVSWPVGLAPAVIKCISKLLFGKHLTI